MISDFCWLVSALKSEENDKLNIEVDSIEAIVRILLGTFQCIMSSHKLNIYMEVLTSSLGTSIRGSML